MKSISIFFIPLFLFSSAALSQSKEDFKLVTSSPDTLFTGIENALHIQTKWDYANISISGAGMRIASTGKPGHFSVITSAATNGTTIAITLTYRLRGEKLKFSYPFYIMPYIRETYNQTTKK